MKTFKEYLEHRDLELYNEINLKKIAQTAALGGALAGSMLGIGGKASAGTPTVPAQKPAMSQKISSSSVSLIDHEKSENEEGWLLKVKGSDNIHGAMKEAKDFVKQQLQDRAKGLKTGFDLGGLEVFGGTMDKKSDKPNPDGSFTITVIKHDTSSLRN